MTIYIVPIEPVDARYTKQWYEQIPLLLRKHIKKKCLSQDVVVIDGVAVPDQTTSGAFLDFGATNVYKSSQAQRISELFVQGRVKPNDVFLVTDAWNFVITPLKYMSDLLDIPIKIHSIWHAGAYDPSDILGVKMGRQWSENIERSWFYASDYNYFATDFHRKMFLKNLNIPEEYHHRAVRAGQPYDYLPGMLEQYQSVSKENIILWPHRYNYDKQPEIAEDLSSVFDVRITQKQRLAKHEFYDLVGRSKVVFSCSLHENLGTSIIESVLAGAIPVVPDRCCYSDIYFYEFRYPAEWTADYCSYLANKNKIVNFISERVDNSHAYADLLEIQRERIKTHYISSNKMIDFILEEK